MRRPPLQIAWAAVERLGAFEGVKAVEIAGSGFINTVSRRRAR
ncbi:MAG: hypothetical protein ACRDYX_14750 [Egibacteraceae bacterium]